MLRVLSHSIFNSLLKSEKPKCNWPSALFVRFYIWFSGVFFCYFLKVCFRDVTVQEVKIDLESSLWLKMDESYVASRSASVSMEDWDEIDGRLE